ncbi:MAG: hypothetical protein ACYCVD_10375 [Desulfitobacteriaceae bacterium]
MEFTLSLQVPFPQGLEKETAQMAQGLRNQYKGFLAWVQAGETPAVPEEDLPELKVAAPTGVGDAAEQVNDGRVELVLSNFAEEGPEPWLLGNWDIEYFYGLSRPADVSCACPFGWIQKVERVIDQQYPIFGVERFPDLSAKAAHMAWLVIKNEIFPEYNAGIASLAVLVLLKRNGYKINPTDEDLMHFIATVRKFVRSIDMEEQDEDTAIGNLGEIIKTWER